MSPPPRGARSSGPSTAQDNRPSRTLRALTFENAAEPTVAGGLLFVVPVLERLGVGAWCAQSPHDTWREPGVLARRIFDELLGRMQTPSDDAAWQLAAHKRDGDVPPPSDRDRESIFGRIEGRVTAAAGDRRRSRAWLSHVPRSATAAGLWIAACRFVLRRHAHLGLASLVRRPARLAFTDTHVDVFFDLTAADVRIRRAGLDIDPGWVPWFGTVVTFHFEDRPWR